MEIGTKVKVIDGGRGCFVANGLFGIIVTRKEALQLIDFDINKYHGEYTSIEAQLYIKDSKGYIYGLCKGFEIEK